MSTFDEVAERYGSLSANITRILESLQDEKRKLEELTNTSQENRTRIAVVEAKIEDYKILAEIVRDIAKHQASLSDELESIKEIAEYNKSIYESISVNSEVIKEYVDSINKMTSIVKEAIHRENRPAFRTMLHELTDRDEEGKKISGFAWFIKEISDAIKKSIIHGLLLFVVFLLLFYFNSGLIKKIISDSIKESQIEMVKPPGKSGGSTNEH